MKFIDLRDGTNFHLPGSLSILFCKIPRLSIKMGRDGFSLNCLRKDPSKMFLEVSFIGDDDDVCISEF